MSKVRLFELSSGTRLLRLLRSGLVVGLAGALLSGCWLQVGHDAGHTNTNAGETTLKAANVATLDAVWSTDLATEASEPMVRGGSVYLTSGGTDEVSGESAITASAFRLADGSAGWSRELITYCCGTPDDLYLTPAAFVGDELWTGYLLLDTSLRPTGDFAGPVRLDPADGDLLGKESSISISPVASEGDVAAWTRVHIASPARTVVVRSMASGTTQWTGLLPGELSNGPGVAPPAISDGQVFVADATRVMAFPTAGCGAATCDPTWTFEMGSAVSTVVAAPGGDDVFSIRNGNLLVALSRVDGAVHWTASLGGTAPGLAVANGRVYVAGGSTIRRFGLNSSVGPTAALSAAATAAPVVAGDVVYVPHQGGVSTFTLGLEPLATLPVTGTIDHLTVADGHVLAVHHPTAGGRAQLSVFAPPA